ncbi:putative nuclease HARBI1 [Engystomops pustulosus]|uniref:putative nuclease HARBI1 n=1 Tax=Engystomops pustulosus TaxID=76066 RepID=UPI003AFA0885
MSCIMGRMSGRVARATCALESAAMDLFPLLAHFANEELAQQPLVANQHRRPRIFRERFEFHTLLDEEVVRQFRLDRTTIQDLYEKLKDLCDRKTKRSHAQKGLYKLLTVLYYLASASFQHCVASRFGISQPTFSRNLHEIVGLLNNLAATYIKFPSNEEEIKKMKDEFYQIAGMPNVISLIDCTHVALVPPAACEDIYRNRKFFRSINVQFTCGPNMMFTDVVAKYPGATHDAFIFENSCLCTLMEQSRFGDSILLGDNGYKLTQWMMTPYLSPITQQEKNFNRAHRKTRSRIERAFGLLKSRFRCLDHSGGALLYAPETVCKIIIACAVLHNICIAQNLEIDIASDLQEQIPFQGDTERFQTAAGQLVRRTLTETYF